jgi:hypothetical protein|tara:strand:+ start:5736 stop:5981 length:246 start_codon:yes stop_codon:yes gene_type:complete
MLNAKEAKKQALYNFETKISFEVKSVLKRISDEVLMGKLKTIIRKDLDPETLKRIRDLGYEVLEKEQVYTYSETPFLISWK